MPKTYSQEFLDHVPEYVTEILPIMKSVEDSWQPSDFLPDSKQESWYDEVRKIREQSAGISDDVLVLLVGNMVTEEALPSYQTWLNRFEGARDYTGTDDTPWAKWTRFWSAEENRHGDVLNRYLYLTGRVDMKAVEKTIQYLIRNGFNPETDGHPYKGLIYTSFQERATRVTHQNTANLAKKQGDALLSKICVVISADEARHEKGYKELMKRAFGVDPEGSLASFEQMMRKMIWMPTKLIEDGTGPDLFSRFSTIVQRTGAYGSRDIADIIQHLLDYWDVANLKNLSPDGARAQEFLAELPERYIKLGERAEERMKKRAVRAPFSWVFNREV